MKLYQLKRKKGGKGVFKMSLVKDAAIETTLLKFSKEEKPVLTFTNEEKRIIYSVAMRPNLEIFRKDVNGEPANVFYNKEFVEEAQMDFFRNNGNKNTSINHADSNTDGVFLFESWIVKDPELDKSKSLGLETLAGDLVQGYKIENDEVWEKVKAGDLDGLSIEAMNLEHIHKNNIEMSTEKKGVLNFIKEGFAKMFDEAAKFEEEIAEVSKWWNTVINDTFALNDIVLRKPHEDSTDEEPNPVGAGEYELKDGRRILTDTEGVIRFIFDAPAGEATDPPADDTTPPADDAAAVEMALHPPADDDEAKKAAAAAKVIADKAAADADNDDNPTEKEKELMEEIVALKKTIATLEAEKVKEAADLETMKAEVIEMKKQTPAAPSIKLTPEIIQHNEEVAYKNMTNAQKTRHNRSQ